MIKSYTIYQPESDNVKTIKSLIRHAINAIAEETDGAEIQLSRFDLIHPSSEDKQPGINYQFSELTLEEVRDRNENLEWIEEDKVSKPIPEQEIVGDATSESVLHGLIIRLPQGKKQYSGLELANKLSNVIESLGSVDIQDFVFHEFIDDDAIDHPYFTLYYTDLTKTP